MNSIFVGKQPYGATKWQQRSWLSLGSLAIAIGAGLITVSATAKNPAWELVPPPPPTPVLNIPPAPVLLPYSFAETASPYNMAVLPPSMPAPPPNPGAGRPTSQPRPQTRPIGIRPANAPNLNIAYARAKGFGEPRQMYKSPYNMAGAAMAFGSPVNAAPVNTWFDSSLRWYAQHVSAQQFYSELASRPEYGVPSSGYAAASGMFEGVLPKYVPPKPVPHRHGRSSGRHHSHHGHRVIAYR